MTSLSGFAFAHSIVGITFFDWSIISEVARAPFQTANRVMNAMEFSTKSFRTQISKQHHPSYLTHAQSFIEREQIAAGFFEYRCLYRRPRSTKYAVHKGREVQFLVNREPTNTWCQEPDLPSESYSTRRATQQRRCSKGTSDLRQKTRQVAIDQHILHLY